MKSIVYRGGLVSFRIPSDWHEEYSDMDGGTFYKDDSGTLRLTVLTLSTREELHSGSTRTILEIVVKRLENKGIIGSIRDRTDGNARIKYEEAAREGWTRLAIFYWIIANPLPPHHARIATFSYTVLAKRRDDPSTRHDVEMLEKEIESATFASDLGVLAN